MKGETGMNTRFLAAAALLLATAGGAAAQAIDQNALYATDAAACETLRDKGAGALGEGDVLTLSFAEGIQGMEFHCSFFDVKTKAGQSTVLVEAVCEAPGEVYPDLLAIGPYDAESIQVTSMNDTMMGLGAGAAEEETAGIPGNTLYYKCDGLSALPR